MPLKTTSSSRTGAGAHGMSEDHTSPRNGQPVTDVLGLTEQLKSSSPDQVLGSMSQASLSQSIGVASIVTAVLMVVLTIGPFLFGSGPTQKQPAKSDTAAAKPATPAATESSDAATTAGEGDSAAPAADGSGKNPKVSSKTLKRLGVDEVKQSDPKKNPLEESVDDLLKDIK